MRTKSHFISAALVLLLVLSTSSLPISQSRYLHMMRRRSHPASKPPPLDIDSSSFEKKYLTLQEQLSILDKHQLTSLEEEDVTSVVKEEIPIFMEEPSFMEQDTSVEIEKELKNHGITKVVVDEEGADGKMHVKEVTLEESTEANPFQFEEDEKIDMKIKHFESKKEVKSHGGHRHYPKKVSHPNKGRRKPHKSHSPKHETSYPEEDMTTLPSPPTDIVTETSPQFHKFTGAKNPPLMLPVTTEGKSNLPVEDPLKVYGVPKELLPIMPGGGSRFEDVEREKLEKKKMSQTKGGDEGSAENGGSHEAESLYSSASLTSLSIAFYFFVSFLHLGRLSL